MTAQSSPAPGKGRSPLAQQLARTCVGLRGDLQATRHLFRDRPLYVLRDPLTFETHAFTRRNYEILVHLRADRPLEQTFERLVDEGLLGPAEEEEFYSFVLDLHRRNLLKLPISDERSSYERYERHRRSRWAGLAMAVFSARRSLLDPSAFLERTERFVRPLFHRAAFLLWAVTVATALVLAWLNRAELGAPLDQVLLSSNLPALWVTLVVLKVVHELGHAYACRILGGHVPEIGVNFILFTPLPYVDASASWSFPSKLDRLIVSAAGMYVELFIAALALIGWCFMEPSFARSMAYNTALMASVVTLAFNLNPLMRFDGYYIFSDLVEVPNLRARAVSACRGFFKQLLLGLPWRAARGEGRGLRTFLVLFGIASVLYKVSLVLGIATVIASEYMVAGLLLGAGYVGLELLRSLRGLLDLLFRSTEMAALRPRAFLAAALLFVALPAGVAWIPLPGRVVAPGIFAAEAEEVYRARRGGFLRELAVAPGREVRRDQVLVVLEDPDAPAALVEAEREYRIASAERRAARGQDRLSEEGAVRRLTTRALALEVQAADVERLAVVSAAPGKVVQCLEEDQLGRWVEQHEPVATVVHGPLQVRCLLDEADLVSSAASPGRRVSFRPVSSPERTFAGRVVRVEPAGSRRIAEEALTHLGGGEIAVSPLTGEASLPHFLVTIQLEDQGPAARPLSHGVRGRVLFQGERTTLGQLALRRMRLFLERLRTAV